MMLMNTLKCCMKTCQIRSKAAHCCCNWHGILTTLKSFSRMVCNTFKNVNIIKTFIRLIIMFLIHYLVAPSKVDRRHFIEICIHKHIYIWQCISTHQQTSSVLAQSVAHSFFHFLTGMGSVCSLIWVIWTSWIDTTVYKTPTYLRNVHLKRIYNGMLCLYFTLCKWYF